MNMGSRKGGLVAKAAGMRPFRIHTFPVVSHLTLLGTASTMAIMSGSFR